MRPGILPGLPGAFPGGPLGVPGKGMLPGFGFPGLPGLRPPQAAAAGPSVPQEVREAYKNLRADLVKMQAAADEAQQNGDDGGAGFKRMLAGEMSEKIKEMEAQHPGLSVPEPEPAQEEPAPSGGGPGPSPGAHMQQMLAMIQQPAALTVTQQQALQYEQEQANSNSMDPEVIEFVSHFDLSDRHAKMLNEQLKHRNNTFEEDLGSLYEILGHCNNLSQRADLLQMQIRWMAEGIFTGAYGPNPNIQKAAKKYKLDPPSACKLADALQGREDPEEDFKRICIHLERSNKPSSMAMMMLKDLKAGNAIDSQPTKAPAIGSYLHKLETSRGSDKKDGRSRSRGRRGGDDRGRSRGRDDRGRDDRGRRRDSRDRGRGGR